MKGNFLRRIVEYLVLKVQVVVGFCSFKPIQ